MQGSFSCMHKTRVPATRRRDGDPSNSRRTPGLEQ